MSKEELWQAVLAQVQLEISPANFTTWFKNTNIVDQNSNEVIVSVPNSFVKEWLEKKYCKSILKILRNIDEGVKDLKFTVGKSELKILKKNSIALSDALSETGQLEFQEFKVDKETNLNPRYTFENFVVGSFNELANAAARAVVENPGNFYNPLFVYGGVGLGKTHLLQATGNEILKKFPEKRIKYITSEKFVSGIITAIRNKEAENFKAKYLKIDVLIIDDIQFLAGKEKTQEEFFHIFNNLYEKNKQIILSSDKPPRAIQALTERLKSRFEGGMIADISMPEFETRLAILKEKGAEKKVRLPEEVLDYIASSIKQNIRELEGALNRLIVYGKLNNKTPDLEATKSLLKDIMVSSNSVVTPRKIIQAIAEFYDLRERELLSCSRRKEIVNPRQVAMYLIREELKSSFPAIGRKFGGKDHTTAIHAYEKILKELGKNENLNQEINLIKQRIYG